MMIVDAQDIRGEIGLDRFLMMDANQVWGVDEAIENMDRLAEFNPWWIEEPTSPDDILGHARRMICQANKSRNQEHCHNAVMFKQLMQAKAIDICRVDSCRLPLSKFWPSCLWQISLIFRSAPCGWGWIMRIDCF